MFNKTDEELEAVARNFLKKIGLEYQVRPDMMTIISKLKHEVRSFKYERVPDEKLPHAEAQWLSDDFVLKMRESVFVQMQQGQPRARMTIAHELSHYLLKHKGLLNRSTQKTMSEIAVPLVRRQESEARRLGPVILAPEYLVPEGATADDIARMFGLSAEAASYRKDEIGAVRRRASGQGRPLPASIANYLEEAKRRGR
jgi:Zn-dependent peptidase ImmA (M78 family)